MTRQRGKLGEPVEGSARGAKAAHFRDPAVALPYVREHFNYDSDTGIFTNKTNRGGGKVVGAVATTKKSNGYLLISIMNVQYLAHRLAWLYHYGKWPEAVIDHINGEVADNRIVNLRDVPQCKNQHNRKGPQKNNKLGMLGVSLNKASGKFRASIKSGGSKIVLGHYDTPEQAHAAYLEAKKEMHKGI